MTLNFESNLSPAPAPDASIAASRPPSRLALTVLIPVRNEAENLPLLVREIHEALDSGTDFELLFIDDGSTDDTLARLRELKREYERIRCIQFEANCGKSAALTAGFRASRGDVIVIMDGDCQNDPRDLPLFLEAIRNCDIVAGVRKSRVEGWRRGLQSRIANRIRNRIVRDGARDSGCGYQAFRRECIERIPYFEGMHRFLPCIFQEQGFTLSQIAIGHRPRQSGYSNYTFWKRFAASTHDLFGVRWLNSRRIRYKIKDQW